VPAVPVVSGPATRRGGCGCGRGRTAAAHGGNGGNAAHGAHAPARRPAADPAAPAPGRMADVVDPAASVEDNCARLGRFLGLDGPVSRDVFVSAVEDAEYRHNLYVSRNTPVFLDRLLANPPHRAARIGRTSTLLARAAAAMVGWGASGFSVVDRATLAARLDACLGCPNLVDPPATVAYRVAGAGTGPAATGSKACALCGCVVARKARLASESCPAEDPDRPGVTRWGEPLKVRR
jgi:hypothetical protein